MRGALSPALSFSLGASSSEISVCLLISIAVGKRMKTRHFDHMAPPEQRGLRT